MAKILIFDGLYFKFISLFLFSKDEIIMQSLNIPTSKSLSNRWLILQYLYPEIILEPLSTAQDTVILKEVLSKINQNDEKIYLNIGHAGTAMRFLTALLSMIENKTFVLDGSSRMRQRPIGILVEALKSLGADIDYINQDGFPPLVIKGKKLSKNRLEIAQNVSSQYISALLLIAPKLPHGLMLSLKGRQVSKPYVQMTLSLLKDLGISLKQKADSITILPQKTIAKKHVRIEGDWSSASYFYGALAVLRNNNIGLTSFDQNSLQGDQKIVEYFHSFGINTSFANGQKIILSVKPEFEIPSFLSFDLLETPDLAQTLAVTCLALGIKCHLTGLQTLRLKETDRLSALQTEMHKLGAKVKISDDRFELIEPNIKNTDVSIKTYDDHRMAMSFAILQKKFPNIQINDPEVVIKSFPDFWKLFKCL